MLDSKISRRIGWFVANVALVAVAICGVALGSAMSTNVFKFLAWFLYTPAILIFLSDNAQAKQRRAGPAVPVCVNLSLDFSVALFLAAYGWFGYATLAGVSALLSAGIYWADEWT